MWNSLAVTVAVTPGRQRDAVSALSAQVVALVRPTSSRAAFRGTVTMPQTSLHLLTNLVSLLTGSQTAVIGIAKTPSTVLHSNKRKG
jgi:hypothetical protein